MTVTGKLAGFIVEANLKGMPSEIVTIVKRAMIDTLGVALAGSRETEGKAVTAFVRKLGCKPTAGVIGGKIRTSSLSAALANGTIAHALDYDDNSSIFHQGHPSTVLLPVVLSLGEELRSSGREVLEAYVLGIEVWAKISNAMPMLHFKGWHPTTVFGTIGATAAAAKLLRLDVEQTMMALGLASSESAGLVQNFGTMTKPFQAGNAARSGIMAAMLANEGFTSDKDIIEGDMGFSAAFYRGSTVDISKMTENLDTPFATISQGITIKRYPCCSETHRSLDAILHLIDLYDIKPEEVEAVDCQVPPRTYKVLFYNDPTTKSEAKFSMQFTMAVALIDRELGLAQFTDEKVNKPAVKDLMKRVTCRTHSNWIEGKDTDIRPDVVIVRLKNGKEYSYAVDVPKGHAKLPLTEEELLTKYRKCAKVVLTDTEVERCIELVWELEKLKDVKELMGIVVNAH
ncbi:MmgE/PrpD family protein [Chloroflexota bacterium]